MLMSPDNEKRNNQRRTVLKGGHIVFNGGRSTINCTVRNMSPTGAKLEVTSVVGIPGTFDLVVDKTRMPCRVVWRTLKQLGVQYRREN